MKTKLPPITDADITRLNYVRKCVEEARALLHQAGASLLEGVSANEGAITDAYLTEWTRLTAHIDALPTTAYQYHVCRTWTGGDLNGAGSQSVPGWPVSFGAEKPNVCPIEPGTADDHLHTMIAEKAAVIGELEKKS